MVVDNEIRAFYEGGVCESFEVDDEVLRGFLNGFHDFTFGLVFADDTEAFVLVA